MSGTDQRYVAPPGEGGGGGVVDTIVGSTQIDVDSTDPNNPVVKTRNSTLGSDSTLVEQLQAGTGIAVDNTNPKKPIVSSTGGAGTVTGIGASNQIHIDNTNPAVPVIHTWNQHTGALDQLVESVQAGTNVTVDATDPKNPVVSAATALTEKTVAANGYTLILTDAGLIISLSNAAAQVLTLPTHASVAFPTGTVIYLNNIGAGLWSIAAAGGVTLNSPYSKVQLATQYAQGTLWYRGADVWQLEGNLA